MAPTTDYRKSIGGMRKMEKSNQIPPTKVSMEDKVKLVLLTAVMMTRDEGGKRKRKQ